MRTTRLVLNSRLLPATPPTQLTIIFLMALEVWSIPIIGIFLGGLVLFILLMSYAYRNATEREVDIFDDYLERQKRLVEEAREVAQ
jgi:hypothetical protein